MMAGVRTIVAEDISSKVAGLDTKVIGLEKSMGDLRTENTQIRREMSEQNAGIRHEMASQNQGVLAAIEKCTIAAQTGNSNLRSEFAGDIKSISEKQGLKSGTLIALGMLALAAFSAVVALIQRPTDNAVSELRKRLDQHESTYVPSSTIDRMQKQVDRHESEIITRQEHERQEKLLEKYEAREEKAKERAEAREDKLRDRVYQLESKATDEVRTRTIQRLDEMDARLRGAEQKLAK